MLIELQMYAYVLKILSLVKGDVRVMTVWIKVYDFMHLFPALERLRTCISRWEQQVVGIDKSFNGCSVCGKRFLARLLGRDSVATSELWMVL